MELWEWWHDPGVLLGFPVESASSWDATEKPGILSRPRRERIPPLELGAGNGAPLDVAGTLFLPHNLVTGGLPHTGSRQS